MKFLRGTAAYPDGRVPKIVAPRRGLAPATPVPPLNYISRAAKPRAATSRCGQTLLARRINKVEARPGRWGRALRKGGGGTLHVKVGLRPVRLSARRVIDTE